MFLGPWHEVKKKPKTLIYLGIFKVYKKLQSLKPNLLILGVENKKPEVNTQPISPVQYPCPSAARAAIVGSQKCGHGGVSVAMLWSRASSFDARFRTASRCPFLPINSQCWADFQEREFLGQFSPICVVQLFFFFCIFHFCRSVIGKRVIIRQKRKFL